MNNTNQLHTLPPLPKSCEFTPYTETQIAAAKAAPEDLDAYTNHGRPLDALPQNTPKDARLYHFEQAAYTLHKQPLDIQLRYADARVRSKCPDEEYHERVLFPRFANQTWKLPDVLAIHLTYVGGLAYCACFAPTQDLRRKYAQILREFVAWRSQYSQLEAWVEQDTHFYPDGTTVKGDVFGFAALGLASVLIVVTVVVFYFYSEHLKWVGFICLLCALTVLSPINRALAKVYVDTRARGMLANQPEEPKKE